MLILPKGELLNSAEKARLLRNLLLRGIFSLWFVLVQYLIVFLDNLLNFIHEALVDWTFALSSIVVFQLFLHAIFPKLISSLLWLIVWKSLRRSLKHQRSCIRCESYTWKSHLICDLNGLLDRYPIVANLFATRWPRWPMQLTATFYLSYLIWALVILIILILIIRL